MKYVKYHCFVLFYLQKSKAKTFLNTSTREFEKVNYKSETCRMANVDQYFDSYDNLEVHRLMLSDKPRTEAYKKAILQNASYFKNKVVMGKRHKFSFNKNHLPICYYVNNLPNCSMYPYRYWCRNWYSVSIC